MWLLNPYQFATQQLWTPAAITTALWLDAADASRITTVSGAVSQWNDKSGNGRNFSQSTPGARPTLTSAGLNGRNVITYGSGLFLGGATASDWGFMHGGQFSVIGVAAPSLTASPGVTMQILGTRIGGLYAGMQMLYRDASPYDEAFAHRVITQSATGVVEAFTANATHPIATAATIYSVLSDPANATIASRSSIRFNGGNAYATNNAVETPTSAATAPQFALRTGSETLSMTGYWAELVVTSNLISTDNRQRIEGYLAHKWGLTANLPAGHPYKTVPPYLTYDTDAAAYIASVEAADGQALETGVKDAINAFVIGCKSDGIWTAIKASCIMAGARTLAGALVPLVGTAPTNFNFVAGDYNRKTGLLGNGATKYLNSNYAIPTANQNNAHVACRASSISGDAQFLLGDHTGATGMNIVTNISVGPSTGQVFSRLNQLNQITTNEAPTEGVYGVSRSGAASYSLRFNGSTRSFTESSATPAGFNIGLFTRTVSPASYFAGRLAFYSIGESLNLALLDARVTRLVQEIEFSLNTGLSGTGYDIDTLRYVNAGYAAGGTLA